MAFIFFYEDTDSIPSLWEKILGVLRVVLNFDPSLTNLKN